MNPSQVLEEPVSVEVHDHGPRHAAFGDDDLVAGMELLHQQQQFGSRLGYVQVSIHRPDLYIDEYMNPYI